MLNLLPLFLLHLQRGLHHPFADHRPNQGNPTFDFLLWTQRRRSRPFPFSSLFPSISSLRNLLTFFNSLIFGSFSRSYSSQAMFGDPFDLQLIKHITPLVKAALGDVKVHDDKTVVVMEGPQFSVRLNIPHHPTFLPFLSSEKVAMRLSRRLTPLLIFPFFRCRLEPSPRCTDSGEEISSTCPRSLKPSSRERPRSRTLSSARRPITMLGGRESSLLLLRK